MLGLSPLALSMLIAVLASEEDRDRPSVFPLPIVVLNGKHLAPVGTPGELCLGGLRLLSSPEKFAVEHPLLKGQRWVKTGWRAARDKDGSWRLLDMPGADREVGTRSHPSRPRAASRAVWHGVVNCCCRSNLRPPRTAKSCSCRVGDSGVFSPSVKSLVV